MMDLNEIVEAEEVTCISYGISGIANSIQGESSFD